jgi:hypothetical protein
MGDEAEAVELKERWRCRMGGEAAAAVEVEE